jgi:hypothetical protein
MDRHVPAAGIYPATPRFVRPSFRRSDIRGSHCDMTVVTTRDGIRTTSEEPDRMQYILPARARINAVKTSRLAYVPGSHIVPAELQPPAHVCTPCLSQQEPELCARLEGAGISPSTVNAHRVNFVAHAMLLPPHSCHPRACPEDPGCRRVWGD